MKRMLDNEMRINQQVEEELKALMLSPILPS